MSKLDNKNLSERKRQILKAVVDAHIRYGDPVGSKYLTQTTQLTCSAATIRNEMAELEEMGYLMQPHTSAGRVPSEQGYKYYVESLVQDYASTRREIDQINEQLRFKLTKMDGILEEASRLAAAFTDYTGIAFKPRGSKARIERYQGVYLGSHEFLLVMIFGAETVRTRQIRLPFVIGDDALRRFLEVLNLYFANVTSEDITMNAIVKLENIMGTLAGMVHPTLKAIYETLSELDTADIHLEGVSNLLEYPEYSDVRALRDLFGVLDEKERLLDVIDKHTTSSDGISVYIGGEADGAMSNTTLIYKTVEVGGKKLAVGVIGPKRMNYSKVIDMITQLTTGIDRMFSTEPRLIGRPDSDSDGE